MLHLFVYALAGGAIVELYSGARGGITQPLAGKGGCCRVTATANVGESLSAGGLEVLSLHVTYSMLTYSPLICYSIKFSGNILSG